MPRSLFSLLLTLPLLPLTGCGGQPLNGQEQQADTPKLQSAIRISPQTTFVTGPLDEEGYVDYAAALNSHLKQGTTPENNAAVMFIRALGPKPVDVELPDRFFQWLEIERPAAEGEYFVSFDAYALTASENQTVHSQATDMFERAMEEPWRREEMKLVADWLDAMEQPLQMVTAGTRRPEYFLPLIVPEPQDDDEGPGGLIAALLPTVQATRSLARALCCRAMLHVGEGRIQAAWDDLMTCQRLGRLVGRGPTLIEALVGIAIDGVAQQAAIQFIGNTKLSADQVKQYLGDLDSLPPLPAMADKMNRCERMMFLDAAQQLARGGKLSDLTGGAQSPFDQVLRTLSTGAIDWNVPMQMANQWYDRISDAMREEDHFTKRQKLAQLEEEMQKIAEETRKPWSMAGSLLLNPRKTMGRAMGQVLIALMLPAVSAAEAAADRADQSFSNLRVAFALAAYHSDVGQYPPQLDELVPKYLPDLPPDIFAQAPLRYRAEGRGYLLYSLGRNGQDDEGRWRDDNPPGDDVHVRMPPVVRPR